MTVLHPSFPLIPHMAASPHHESLLQICLPDFCLKTIRTQMWNTSWLFITMTEMPNMNNLKEERFILAQGFKRLNPW